MKIQAKSSQRIAVKIGVSRQVAIPKRIHDRLGLVPGDYLQVELKGDKLIMTPQAMIEKRLAAGLDDMKKGRMHGPFSSAAEMASSLRKSSKARSS
jgi:AbrB family looped-hinge helix DNA binding protein